MAASAVAQPVVFRSVRKAGLRSYGDAAAEFAEKYIRKGSRLLLEGKIRTRYWEDRNAIKHSTTSVYVDSFELLPRGGQ